MARTRHAGAAIQGSGRAPKGLWRGARGFVRGLARRAQERPWLFFVGPALLILGFFLVYPSVATIWRSFYGRGATLFGNIPYVGLENWRYVFTHPTMTGALRNNALWVGVFTVSTVGLGTILAVLLDRVKYERIMKSVIFVPAAISYVGASVIWRFVYAYRPVGQPQVGVLNALVVALGGEPQGWMILRPWVNNLLLIVVAIWIWTGFCMVIMSAAYKNIPKQLMEASRIDGANEWQTFRKVILPLLWPTATVVGVTMIVQVLKTFDVVYVMTNGAFNTEVVANRMYKELFNFRNYGRASAIAVALFIFLVPVMIVNIRRFTGQGSAR